MQRRREGIVGTLRTVDVVVGVQNLLPREFIAAIGDDLVKVHVGLGAATRLPNGKGEIVFEFALQNFIRGADDQTRLLFIQKPKRVIGYSASLFYDGKSVKDALRHFFLPDFKVFKTALRLRPPITVGGHLNLTHTVAFGSKLHFRTLVPCFHGGFYKKIIPHHPAACQRTETLSL